MKKAAVVAAVFGMVVAIGAADVMAAGGRGAGNGQAGASSTTVRPAGSQRKDGSFLTTGVTANGATTRPTNGSGVRDGSRINVTAPVAVPVAQ